MAVQGAAVAGAVIGGVQAGMQMQGQFQQIMSKEQQAKGIERGARTLAGIEEKKRGFAEEELQKIIERRRPFAEVGERAAPLLTDLVSGKETDVMALPSARAQSDLINQALSPETPENVRQRAFANLEAIESEKYKGRLVDLVGVGAGGVAGMMGPSVDLGTALSQSLSRQANVQSQALMQAAVQRQNIQNKLIGELGELPGLIETIRGPRYTTDSPYQLPATLPAGSFTPSMQAPLTQQLQTDFNLGPTPSYLTDPISFYQAPQALPAGSFTTSFQSPTVQSLQPSLTLQRPAMTDITGGYQFDAPF